MDQCGHTNTFGQNQPKWLVIVVVMGRSMKKSVKFHWPLFHSKFDNNFVFEISK